jgi:2-polyprenyl-3-methyl-5-hydroxy-6-metoxy-1,4-benzoquinol methylase
MGRTIPDPSAQLRILVVLASYGISNDRYLLRLIEEYRSMSFFVDIVVLSNLKKQPAPDIEVLVGLPSRDPWSLPFGHKKVFADRIGQYDLFVYSEDDVLITEKNLRAFLEVSSIVREDEIAGFFRIEDGPNGNVNYPDVHAHFHWDATSISLKGGYTLAKFTNEHAGCYILTQSQLRRAIKSGGFLVGPHEWRYHLPETAATDPYTQCGFAKVVPISHLEDFTVHHLPNKYVGKYGVDGPELSAQVDTMLRLAENACAPMPLLKSETKLWRAMYSKDYYEPVNEQVTFMIPPKARSVLSIGCGSGATECWLAERGLRVAAVPLDPVICSSAAARGVEMVFGDFRTAKEKLGNEHFDCLLYLNVLHLVRKPIEVLILFKDLLSVESAVIIESPNMLFGPAIWRRFRNASRFQDLGNYDLTGAHFTSPGKVRRWCHKAGLKIESTMGIFHPRAEVIRNLVPGLVQNLAPDFLKLLMAPKFVTVARKSRMGVPCEQG